jgi:hypothetical protein
MIESVNGCDFAERLDRFDLDEQILGGDVVGVFGGKISRRTAGADWVMAISTKAVVVAGGGATQGREGSEEVAFIGQVPVRVRGPVEIADYIVASGLEDGTAIAVSPDEIRPEQSSLIVGRAWAASAEQGVKTINTVVGLPESASTTLALSRQVDEQSDELAEQRELLDRVQRENDELASRLAALEGAISELTAR